MRCLAVIDGAGVYGSVFHYAFVIAFVGSAFLVFIYLWRKGRLDMDEAPKYQMMKDDEVENQNDQEQLTQEEKHDQLP